MKASCENIVRCANLYCYNNEGGYYCKRIVVALDENGKCALCLPKESMNKEDSK